MQGLMKADHQFYKSHGIYDFPQKQNKRIWQMRLVGTLMAIPSVPVSYTHLRGIRCHFDGCEYAGDGRLRRSLGHPSYESAGRLSLIHISSRFLLW